MIRQKCRFSAKSWQMLVRLLRLLTSESGAFGRIARFARNLQQAAAVIA
jgi:ABC-type Fe2+-enterobactin transport system substrate-binding protein